MADTTKVVTGAGHFDVMNYAMSGRIAEDIYKSYSEYGVKAHYEALKEAVKSLPQDKIPSYLIVVDRATLKPKVFVNQKEVKLTKPGELDRLMDKYKKFYAGKTFGDEVRNLATNEREYWSASV